MTRAIKGISSATDHSVGKLLKMALGTAGEWARLGPNSSRPR